MNPAARIRKWCLVASGLVVYLTLAVSLIRSVSYGETAGTVSVELTSVSIGVVKRLM